MVCMNIMTSRTRRQLEERKVGNDDDDSEMMHLIISGDDVGNESARLAGRPTIDERGDKGGEGTI